jgi:hypothetical protein
LIFQTNSPLSSRKLAQHDKKHHDDEDNWSVASSYPQNFNTLMVLFWTDQVLGVKILSIFHSLKFSQFWEYKYNKITFGGSNYFLYTSKLFKTIVKERENGEGSNSSFTYIIFNIRQLFSFIL